MRDHPINQRFDTESPMPLKMVDAFADMGVTSEMIQKRIQKRIRAINPAPNGSPAKSLHIVARRG